MKLTLEGIDQRDDYATAGVMLPSFSVADMQARGRRDPRWIHIGPGNIFRVFIARLADELVAAGHDWPITGVVPMDPRELDEQLSAHDLMSLGVTLNEDGSRKFQVIAGLSEGLAPRRAADYDRLSEIIRNPRVSLMSFTITEKGYVLTDSQGELPPATRAALDEDPHAHHDHTMLLVAALLLHRFEAGGAPITLLSCDNFSHNGDRLRQSVLTVVQEWESRGLVDQDFLAWVRETSNVAFPISCIDKITPRPNAGVAEDLSALGFDDMEISAPFGMPLAGFVNTEPTEYLIVENVFAGERPPLEELGVKIVDRSVCDDFERMKVTTCLNPLHTALAVSGCLLRFPTIDSEMRDRTLAALVHRLGWVEGLPVVVDPGIVSPQDFLREVEEVRFPNPYLPDDPARIATDTSQKLPIRFGETVKSYIERGMDLDTLVAIPLTFALWCRYLMGVADDGLPFTPSPDPLLAELQAHVAGVELGGDVDAHQALAPILSNPTIFGLDLYTTPLAARVEDYFVRLTAAPGAVRRTLDKEMNIR